MKQKTQSARLASSAKVLSKLGASKGGIARANKYGKNNRG